MVAGDGSCAVWGLDIDSCGGDELYIGSGSFLVVADDSDRDDAGVGVFGREGGAIKFPLQNLIFITNFAPEMEPFNSLDTPRLTLRKAEKLRHRSLVEALFTEGKSFYEFPLRLTWRLILREKLEANFRSEVPPRVGPLQMLITVPKKKVRHAVDRVRIRRRIREAYRLNRLPLLSALKKFPGLSLHLAFIYINKGDSDYHEIEKKMCRLIQKLEAKIQSFSPEN